MKNNNLIWIFIYFTVIGIDQVAPKDSRTMIHPVTIDEIINSTVTFRCNHSGDGVRIRWQAHDNTNICQFELSQCSESLHLEDDRYSCTCEKPLITETTVSLQISNITTSEHNTSWTCQVFSEQEIKEPKALLLVKVPVQTLTLMSPEEKIHAIENSNIQFHCITSFGRPIPNVSWIIKPKLDDDNDDDDDGFMNFKGNNASYEKENGFTSVTSTLDYSPNRTVNGWLIYCSVSRKEFHMKEIRSSSVSLNIMYPPHIDTIEDMNVAEGSYFNFSCPVHDGNPNATVLSWTRDRDDRTWTSARLSLTNVTRYDDMTYKCTAFNIMSTIHDNKTVQGITNTVFHLNVEYEANVYDFFVVGYSSNTTITVKEGDNVIFRCYVDGYPIPNTTIMFQDGTELFRTQDTVNISYTRRLVTCLDTGEYVCTGRNKHNSGQGSKKNLNLSVMCSPMVNPFIPVNSNISSKQHAQAVMQLHCLAYPAPTVILWHRFNGSTWETLVSSTDIEIQQSDFNFSLTIHNVLQSDIGFYRVTISNIIGSLDHSFHLNIEDKPDPPTDFHVVEDLITATTITVQWIPSFDGGRPQHFVLNYSKSGLEWKMDIVQSNGYLRNNYTLKGLQSVTLYRLLFYAENIIGRSPTSDALFVQTALEPVKEKELLGNVIGIAIGSAIGVAFSSLAFLAGIWIFKKRKPRQSVGGNVSYKNMKNEESKRKEAEMNVYDKIDIAESYNHQRNKEECHIVTGDNNDFAVQYQKLGPIEMEKNQYYHLLSKNKEKLDFKDEKLKPYTENETEIPEDPTYINTILQ